MMLTRRLAIGLPLAAAACGDEPVRREFPPLHYDYLTPLRLNVASIALGEPPPPGPLDAQAAASPAVTPAAALQQMAQDRLSAGGSAGRAVFTIDEARIVRVPGGLEGTMAVHLDVLTTEGARSGFAEARVSQSAAGVGRDLRGALYDMTRQMMERMNVEFEFQVRQSLKDWLQDASIAPPPAPVERQELPPPRVSP